MSAQDRRAKFDRARSAIDSPTMRATRAIRTFEHANGAPAAVIAFQTNAVVYAVLIRTAAETLAAIAADPMHPGAELDVERLLAEAQFDGVGLKALADSGVETDDDLIRCADRDEQAEPFDALHRRIARFARRRHIRQDSTTLERTAKLDTVEYRSRAVSIELEDDSLGKYSRWS